jgi:formate dehydrogenase iron-sulfur subunit
VADDTGTRATRGDRKSRRTNPPKQGIAQKCTMCYDRMTDGQTPACAKTCPTTSIKYGDRAEMVAQARDRVAALHRQGLTEARLYGANDHDGVGGTGSVFLLLDEPEVYGLPPDPRVPTADLPQMFRKAGMAAAGMIAAVAVSFVKSSFTSSLRKQPVRRGR